MRLLPRRVSAIGNSYLKGVSVTKEEACMVLRPYRHRYQMAYNTVLSLFITISVFDINLE